MILSGDGLKAGEIPKDCNKPVSHMDLFPSVMEYLRLPLKEDWELDGKSRLEWKTIPLSERDVCDLDKTKPAIALSGGYIFDELEADNLNKYTEMDECLSSSTSTGRFHYNLWSQCTKKGKSPFTKEAPKLCK